MLINVFHDLRRLFPDRRGRSRLDQKRQNADAEPSGVEPAPGAFPRWRKLRQVVGCVQRCSSFSFPDAKSRRPIRTSARNKILFYMLLSIFSIAYPDLRRKSKTVPMLRQYCGVFSLFAVTASYKQVKFFCYLGVLLLLSPHILSFLLSNHIKPLLRANCQQVNSCPDRNVFHVSRSCSRIKRFDEFRCNRLFDQS